ncbi:MAG: UTP--glucose-1-phosphate uridylyltransferase [Phycisphaerae bacterium]
MDRQAVAETLRKHDQEHVLRFFDELDASQQEALLNQISQIDFDRLEELIEQYVKNEPEVEIPSQIEPPEIVPARPVDETSATEQAAGWERGEQLLREGKVAAFVVAGGQGTRLGYEGPKGCFEVTPIARKSLFQVFAEQILAASGTYGKTIPWYIMTSPINDVATRAFFRQHNYFGLDPDDVFFFTQGTLPSINYDGKLMLAEKNRLATNPDGHGGSLAALARSGALEDMAGRGVELISYFQVDNPLVKVIDPLFLGLHSLREAEMSAKCLPKRDPMEKLGNFCLVDGNVTVIEYSDLPEELARQTLPDGRLKFSAGSIAIHAFSRSFVERLNEGGTCRLPLHRADKEVPHLDAEGQLVEPEEPNAVKLEMFVFDAMPLAEECVILETEREQEFSPVKNAAGADSPTTCLHDQVRRAAAWLEEAGVSVPRDADGQIAAAIEISPLFAADADELKQKVGEDLQIDAGGAVYLE